ncbi:MAG: hypothetical protein K8T91_20365 [Planctomycetes bacterium]|nr:hypothetical protein [Planctomycetota bacterium]
MTPESIAAIMVKLEVAQRQSLFIVLANDGLVNRLGTGAANNTENDLFIGRTSEPLFAKLRAEVRNEWMDRFGSYDVPSKAGSVCVLSVLFKATDGEDGGMQFEYGSESQGPPGDICQFVTEAVHLTDPWYEEQKQMAAAPKKRKPWWRLW